MMIEQFIQANVNFSRLLAALDLFNKVKGANSRITPDAAEGRW